MVRPPDPEENELIPITAGWRWNSDFAVMFKEFCKMERAMFPFLSVTCP